MKQISILGCGWLGTPLAEQLLKKDYVIKGSTTSLSKMNMLEDLNIKPYHIDIYHNNLEYIDYFLKGSELLIITIPPIREETQPSYADNFKKITPYIKKHNIKQVIMMSSVSIYAPSTEVITELYNSYSNEPTAKQIRDAESVLLCDPSINACILRLGGLFSADRKPVNYIAKREFLDNPDLPINMIHLEDILAFSMAIIEKGFNSNCIYNIVSPNYESRKDYYQKEAEKYNIILPPLGENNWETQRKISGKKISELTNINYKY